MCFFLDLLFSRAFFLVPVSTCGGRWRHLVIVWTRPSVAFYFDSLLSKTSSHSISNFRFSSGYFLLGQLPGYPPEMSYSGQLAEVNMYPSALGPRSIRLLYLTCHLAPGSLLSWTDFRDNVSPAVKEDKPCNAIRGTYSKTLTFAKVPYRSLVQVYMWSS